MSATLYVAKEMKDQIAAIAAKDDRTLAAVVSLAIRAYARELGYDLVEVVRDWKSNQHGGADNGKSK